MIAIQSDTVINFTKTEIILGTPYEIPPVFKLYMVFAKMYIYIVVNSKMLHRMFKVLLTFWGKKKDTAVTRKFL